MPLILDSSSESSFDSYADEHEQRRTLHHTADVVIVGAGILGAALAVALGDTGRSVILLEKSLKEPDRIVGELLQPGGVEALKALGLRDCLEDIDAITVKGYEVIFKGHPVEIPYPAHTATPIVDETPRPTPAEGRSFHHGRFVAKLRSKALAHPNVTVFETEVVATCTSDATHQVLGVESLTRKTQRDFFFASLTVICDGYNSKFRKQYIKHTPVARSKFFALELIDCPLPRPMHGHVVLSPKHAPILLYQIGTHETRILIDVPENLDTASVKAGGVKSYLHNHVRPALPEQVQPSFVKALENSTLRSMPNSFLPPSTNLVPGLAMLGDALNMRHPLTGGGMTVALTDVVLIKSLLDPSTVPDLDDTTLVLAQLRKFHWQRKNLTFVINLLAQGLYSIFAANDVQLRYLQQGCFAYFERGGACISEPAGLLAGMFAQPLLFFYHFTSVAFLSIWLMFLEKGILGLITGASLWEAVMVLTKAARILLPFIIAELRS